MLLDVKGLTVCYGKSTAIHDVSLQVPEGGLVNIIGANGAGKSTLLRAVAGLVPLSEGEIRYEGSRIDGLETSDIVKRRLVLVPEGRQLFPYLSVMANLKLGASLRKDKDGIARDLAEVFEYFPVLRKRLNQKATTLSGGEQEMLAIGRGLMAKPKLLMMDEPSLGLAPLVIQRLEEVIRNVNQRGVTVLLVEQNIHLGLEVASRVCVLQVGRMVLEGNIDEIKSSAIVKRAYLGG
jgi:branched-chain amino acid transport system ATP-binding protein